MRPATALVASDLDGTLFDPTHELSSVTIDALRRLKGRGLPLVAATGRSHRSAVPRLAKAGTLELAVCSNGATVYDFGRDELVLTRPVDAAIAAETVERLRAAVPSMCFAWEFADGLGGEVAFLERRGKAVEEYGLGDATDVDFTGVLKLMAMQSEHDDDTLLSIVRDTVPAGVTATSSGIGFIEITGDDVTKASTLARVVDDLGIGAERVLAFGDQPNDIAMLGWAGWGVAMANAHPEAKAVADEVIGHHADHAVATYLDTL